MKLKLLLTYTLLIFFVGCKTNAPTSKRNYEVITSDNFDPSKLSRITDGFIQETQLKTEFSQVILSLYHNPHQWEYNKLQDILNQPLEEWNRKCSVCNLTETFIVKK